MVNYMKNIIIYNEEAKSSLVEMLQNNDEYYIQCEDSENIKQADELNPDVIILDAKRETIQNIAMTTKFHVPVILISDSIIDGLKPRAEAFDYIITPVNSKELDLRVKNMLKIKELKNEISFVSTTDELTGLFNRRYLHERLEAEIARAKRYHFCVSCLLIDIDFFKVINDMYGYDWGDVLLKLITDILKRHIRKEDILTRYGDEEFLIVLPNTSEDNAYIFAERVRKDVEKLQFFPDGEEEAHPITISGGISCYPYLENIDESANSIIRYAEHALYNAKKRGKNRVITFSQVNLEM